MIGSMTTGSYAVTKAAGITFRQLDYWTTVGYIHADEDNPGEGRARNYRPEEIEVACLMGRLTRAGLTPLAAHDAARQLAVGKRANLHDFVISEGRK